MFWLMGLLSMPAEKGFAGHSAGREKKKDGANAAFP
jgi:hypothetical protein